MLFPSITTVSPGGLRLYLKPLSEADGNRRQTAPLTDKRWCFWWYRSDPNLSTWSRLRCWCTGALTGRHTQKPFRTPADARNPAASSFITDIVWRWSTEPRVRKKKGIVVSTPSRLVFIRSGIGVRNERWICVFTRGRRARRYNQLYKWFYLFNLVFISDAGHVCLIVA